MGKKFEAFFCRRGLSRGVAVLAFMLVLACLSMTRSGFAAVIYVDTTLQSPGNAGDCTLGEAITAANTDTAVDGCIAGSGDDLIYVPKGDYVLTAVDNNSAGPNGLPLITSPITIQGDGADKTVIRRQSASEFRILYVNNAEVSLSGITITGGDPGSWVGGGVFAAGSTVQINHSIISGNTSDSGGGISSVNSTLSIFNTEFSRNTAPYGGGIGAQSGPVTVIKSTITDNEGTNGAGLYTNGCRVNVNQSTFSRNRATGVGGGLYVTVLNNVSELYISNSSIHHNEADYGGGLFFDTPDPSNAVRVVNSTIAHNTASFRGGGVHADSDVTSPFFQNVTISENSAALGGGIYNEFGNAPVDLGSTILAKNSAGTDPDGNGDFVSNDYNLFGDISAGFNVVLQANDLIGPAGLAGFVDDGTPGNGHFPLLSSSQAIDAGGPDCLPYDQIGQSRINGCDIGAIEFSGPSCIEDVAKPVKAKYTFYYDATTYDSDRISLTAYLGKDAGESFLPPFDEDLTVTITIPDPDNPGTSLLLFEKTIPAGTVSGTKKYRYTAAPPGIRDLTFYESNSTRIYFYLFADELNLLESIRAALSPEQYLDFIRRIDSFTVTILTECSEWVGSADLKAGFYSTHKQQMELNP